MNQTEQRMLSILKDGAENHGYVGVKAEFEAEGTRTDELLRLIELTRKANLKLGLKIGGCEAVRDLIESKQFGVEYVIAPMIETPYSLSKFIDAKNKVYTSDEQLFTEFLFNVETVTAYDHRDELISIATNSKSTDGIVFGRVDFTMSAELPREEIDSDFVTNAVANISTLCATTNQDLVVGGGISIDCVGILRQIASTFLSRFETRKIIFSADSLNLPAETLRQGLLNAVHFELLWLLNKREYYRIIEAEDEKRIEMLETRWRVLGSV